MKVYFSAPQNTPYQREFIQTCSEKNARAWIGCLC